MSRPNICSSHRVTSRYYGLSIKYVTIMDGVVRVGVTERYVGLGVSG